MTLTTSGLPEAADRLIAAAAAPRQCDPVRDILSNSDIAADVALDLLTVRLQDAANHLGDFNVV
jgi:2-keto-4-pentenoate hydratase